MAAKSLSENGVNSYHVAKDTPFVGVVCILTSVHICLYDLGIIDWRLFLSEDDFELNNACVLFIVALVGFGGIFLICLSRVCLTISSHHLKYRGILTTKMIPWAGVTRIMPGKRRDSLAIWSGSTRVRIVDMFSKQRELCASIIDHVRKVSPHAKIVMAAKSPSENGVNSYHVAKMIPVTGVVCILASVYLCLYDLGIIDSRLSRSMDDLEVDNVCVLFIVAFFSFGGIFSICLSRVCITISSHHLKYRGILTTRMIPWACVTRIIRGERPDYLELWSGSTRVQIEEMIFSKHRELCESIIDHVRKVSPHVKIDPRPRWWRFTWRRQRRDDL